MISASKANNILNNLTGTIKEDNSLLSGNRWMGLCKQPPNRETGEVNSEPTATSYARTQIASWENTSKKWARFGMASKGKIENEEEIQFKTAKQAWTDDDDLEDKLRYWFISETKSGDATTWGEIKSPLLEGQEDTDEGGIEEDSEAFFEVIPAGSFEFDEEKDYYVYRLTVDYSFPIRDNDEARVIIKNSDSKEIIYPRTTEFSHAPALRWQRVTLDDGVSYLKLGDLIDVKTNAQRDDRDYYPFTFLYHQVGDVLSEAELIIYRPANEKFVFNIYEVGIRVPRNTVATFYDKQIQIEIGSEDDIEN